MKALAKRPEEAAQPSAKKENKLAGLIVDDLKQILDDSRKRD